MRVWVDRAYRMAQEERNLSLFLLLLSLVMFVVFPLAESGVLDRHAVQVAVTLLMLASVLAMSVRPRMTLVAAIGAAAVVFVRWTAHIRPEGLLAQADAPVALAFFFWMMTVMLFHAVREGRVTLHRVFAGVAVYLLIGLVFAFAFEIVVESVPEALDFSMPEDRGVPAARLIYFSLSTLTTIGYGDITPVHPIARSLAMFEGLVGQLFPAVLLARLVALELEHRRKP